MKPAEEHDEFDFRRTRPWFQGEAYRTKQAADVALTADDLDRIHAIVPAGAAGARDAEDRMPVWT